MAYEANRDNNQMTQDERNIKNNTNNVKNAAEVAIASGHPYGVAIGGAVKAADKLTGGKSSEMLGKAINQVNKASPGGKYTQNALNKLNESGAGDKIGQAAAIKNGIDGGGTGGADAATKTAETGAKSSNIDNASSASSSSSEEKGIFNGLGSTLSGLKPPSIFKDEQEEMPEQSDPTDTMFEFTGKMEIKKVLIISIPVFALLLLFFMLTGAIGAGATDFDDALGASSISGGQTGDIVFEATSKEAKNFYERINTVKLAMQAQGKSVDVLKLAAVYHILNINNNEYDYDYMTTPRIYEIAHAMFNGNVYDEELFKSNLANDIFLKYFPDDSQSRRERYAEDVFDYIERYYSFIGFEGVSCASAGTCNYDIKGFYIPNAGNVTKPMQISNLMVRLMECGQPYGNGNYNTPIEQAMVPFEDYVAGVAYAEIGPSAPLEATKAQMVAARSFALSRPTAMGNSLGKKLEQENGQWVLQISSCVADQVFCNIDEGCSYMGQAQNGNGIVRSGMIAGAQKTRESLALDHQIRTAAAATAGEVLVNSEGYIIASSYIDVVSNQFSALANQGKDYKQILLEVYNSGSRNFGATDVQKMSCNTSGSSDCGQISTGPYASWKQYIGPWKNIPMGNSGSTVGQIGCLVTSVTMLLAKSGVPTVLPELNPGTFVEFLNKNGGFAAGGNFLWNSVTKAAPTFHYMDKVYVSGYSKQQKLQKLSELMGQGYYVVAEVKGNTGQHWVAIDAIAGDTVVMMDPGGTGTDLWASYDWRNTSTYAYFKVG